MLTCTNLNTWYGPAHILFDVDINVSEGRVLSILGRNGVGKSTLLKSIMGVVSPGSGDIEFCGRSLFGISTHKVAQSGIGYVPEDRRVFADLTVEENLEIAELKPGAWSRREAFCAFPPLEEFRSRRAGLLSGGQQQMLSIARAMMGNPRLLLVDEPTEGLSPIMVRTLARTIHDLKNAGQTMVVAAQDLAFALSIADDLIVLDRGRVVYQSGIENARVEIDKIRTLLAV
ncbi:ABC transporter ATP-binding protein [Cupriavidus numazuensis]|uniref:High-affinity branched-chain amino acid transport ATP-binding protein LivF n=1 Tax=Cupriavidus numazuensis TaxID=221992 RepID=A0ABM8TVP0_9BURK|nr:ABC transporter ATP-binding protein [Cupriavidus numazuensis]CAG2160747.1 High-affinity branched-chain amino acid transport ATP-binding protein LivF [Cupriavidus numazuensis]